MTYYEKKEKVRNEAIMWQMSFADQDYSWYDVMMWGNYFYNMGKRYGLLREFHENGIC